MDTVPSVLFFDACLGRESAVWEIIVHATFTLVLPLLFVSFVPDESKVLIRHIGPSKGNHLLSTGAAKHFSLQTISNIIIIPHDRLHLQR